MAEPAGPHQEPFSTLEVVESQDRFELTSEKEVLDKKEILDEKELTHAENTIEEKECIAGHGGDAPPEAISPRQSRDEKHTHQPLPHRIFWGKRKISAFIVVGLLLIGIVAAGAVGGMKLTRLDSRVRYPRWHKDWRNPRSKVSASVTASGAKSAMSGSATAVYQYVYPTAVSPNSFTVDVLAVGMDLSMHEKLQNTTTMPLTTPWLNLGRDGIYPGVISAVSRKENTIDAFARGLDGALYHKSRNMSNQWTPSGTDWDYLGGIITSAPEVVSWGDERLDIFVISADSALWQRTWDTAGWRNWSLVGGSWAFDTTPTAVSWTQGRIDVFLMKPDTKELLHRFLDNNATSWQPFSGFQNLGGYLAGRPSVVSWGVGRLDIFVRGGDEGLWHLSYSNDTHSWSDWARLGSNIQGEPSAISWDKNRLDVFVWGKDYSYNRKSFDGTDWLPKDGFESLGGAFSGPPRAVARSTSKIDLFGCSTRGTVLHATWDNDLKSWSPQSGFEDWQMPV